MIPEQKTEKFQAFLTQDAPIIIRVDLRLNNINIERHLP